MAFKFYCPRCGHSEYISGSAERVCYECGWNEYQDELSKGLAEAMERKNDPLLAEYKRLEKEVEHLRDDWQQYQDLKVQLLKIIQTFRIPHSDLYGRPAVEIIAEHIQFLQDKVYNLQSELKDKEWK